MLAPNAMVRERLHVEPLDRPSIPFVVDYLTRLTDDDIERMGMLREKLPSGEVLTEQLRQSVDAEPGRRREAYLVWLRGSQPIGYAALKRIQFGLYGDMHLHLVSHADRGRGLGATLFCFSALSFYQTYRLQLCLCEPRTTNLGPNRMLQKIGFPLLKTFRGCSSDLTYPTEVSQYLITPDVARVYLRSTTLAPDADRPP
jgi:hypothetical protein